ncbi:nucleotidyltransferase domain-containing protein [bacterium]|nr:nucleotidyltransferase domain-containing protein [bacterium]MBT6831973.1 nucleotidyltransferase domain-containing protein [bacterium]MBT6996116.1 nucleotidyltransferase domain-containing protein [bacterium]MBT7772651.1 nucleotidyltransferase domain-containing protein [bacterium]
MKNLEKKAKIWSKILGKLPGVRAIFLSGSVAANTGNENSDIDFFVVTKSGKIWTARFFIFLILKISGELAKPHRHARKICPNHFIAEHALEIAEKDAYAANLFSKNRPLHDPQKIFENFVAANSWVEKFGEKFEISGAEKKIERKNSESFENFLEKIQRAKIERNPDFGKSGAKIILNTDELRFHPMPKNRGWKKPA